MTMKEYREAIKAAPYGPYGRYQLLRQAEEDPGISRSDFDKLFRLAYAGKMNSRKEA